MLAVAMYDQPVCYRFEYLDWYIQQPITFLIGLPRFDKIVFARMLNFLRLSWSLNVPWIPTCVVENLVGLSSVYIENLSQEPK